MYFVESDQAPLFSNSFIDGGLLILSRFPIIESDFKNYNYGFLSDAFTYKGVLYAKIIIQDRVLHLFNTHTQASYFSSTVEAFKESINTRADQIKTVRKFIEDKTQGSHHNDLIMLCGDLNVNALKSDRSIHSYRKMLDRKVTN